MLDLLRRHFWIICAAASLFVHVGGGAVLSSQASQIAQRKPQTVKVKIVEKKPEPKIAEVPKPPPPKPKPPEPKPKPKPLHKPKVATERPAATPTNQPPPKPVQGLSADAMSKGGKVGVALGNTLMTGDTGERPKEAPKEFTGDLSADAHLIADSIVKPEYTDAAIEANFEGPVAVEVFVDDKGAVTDAELKRKVGYGMDERILATARKARFSPRKDRYGKAETGWTEIKFRLELP